MKKTFKIKSLVVCMIFMMVFSYVPSIYAAAWVNQCDENSAEGIISVMSDKTDLHPGDEFTLTISADKIPARGLASMNVRVSYDKTKVDVATYRDEYGDVEDIKFEGMYANTRFYTLSQGTCPDDTFSNAKACVFGVVTQDYKNNNMTPGKIGTIKFKVLDGAEGGAINIHVSDDIGFSISTTAEPNPLHPDIPDGRTLTDDQKYLKTNLDQMKIVVPATGIRFEGISGVTLNTKDHKSENVSSYVKLDPENSTDTDNIKWDTEDHNIATVDNNGTVTAVNEGTTNVVVSVGKYKATLPVSVTVPIEGVSFEGLERVDLDVTTKPTMDISSYVKLQPSNAKAASYKWSSKNDGVVRVDNGVLTAVGKGNTEVEVEVGGFTATVPVYVTSTIGSVSFSRSQVTLDTKDNNTFDLNTLLQKNPADADVNSITWQTSDDDVVDVDTSGKLTAKGVGDATITVNVDGHTATINVSVTVPLESISLDKESVTVYKGDTEKVVVTANPTGAKWDTLDASLRTGDQNAMAKAVADGVEITGLKEGNAEVFVAANGGATDPLKKTISVIVKENPITSVSVTAEDDEEVLRGKTKQLTASYETREPESVHKTTDDTTVTWKSLSPDVATVDENGVVTGLKEGTAEIQATIAGKTDSYTVTVKEIHADGIVFSDDTIKGLEDLGPVTVGDTVEVEFTVDPEDCTDTAEEIEDFVHAEFDDELVDVTVTFDDETRTGKLTITAKKAGNAEVDVTAGEPVEGEEQDVWKLAFEIVDPVVEEAPDTGDMPIALLVCVMAISLAGIVVSKKVLVK